MDQTQNAGKITAQVLVSVMKVTKATPLTTLKVAVGNVRQMMTVLRNSPVFETSALTLVLEPVVHMPYAKFIIMFHYALAPLDIQVIRSSYVEKNPLHRLHEQTHAYHRLVDQTHSAERSIIKASALVCQIILEALLAVVLNALLTQSVHHKWLV